MPRQKPPKKGTLYKYVLIYFQNYIINYLLSITSKSFVFYVSFFPQQQQLWQCLFKKFAWKSMLVSSHEILHCKAFYFNQYIKLGTRTWLLWTKSKTSTIKTFWTYNEKERHNKNMLRPPKIDVFNTIADWRRYVCWVTCLGLKCPNSRSRTNLTNSPGKQELELWTRTWSGRAPWNWGKIVSVGSK